MSGKRSNAPNESKAGLYAGLSVRAQSLLKALIEHYIKDGQPVGSRTLSKDARIGLSPATIRNVMSDLEELGFIASPHTSAGRVPTVQGYRTFVDSLLTVRSLEVNEIERIRAELDSGGRDRGGLVETASQILSEFTNCAGLVTVTPSRGEALRHVEFLPLSDNQVLVILVVNQHEVQNRIIKTERRYSEAELQQAANYLNQEFAGRGLVAIRKQLVTELRKACDHLDQLMSAVVEMADKALMPAPASDLVVSGQTRLMEHGELADVDRLRGLFDAFNQKRDILYLLDQCQSASGVHLFIGEESGYQMLDACTVVTSPYEVEGEVVGVLGVIGPTRMAYERVIPIVDVTARVVGAALNPRQ